MPLLRKASAHGRRYVSLDTTPLCFLTAKLFVASLVLFSCADAGRADESRSQPNTKEMTTMTSVLKLQTLHPDMNSADVDAIFISSFSGICPETQAGKGIFEME